MADNTNNNDPVVIEDPVVDVDNDTNNDGGSVSGGATNNNVKYITIIASVVMSIIIYFFMFSDGGNEDVIDPSAIVRDDKVAASKASGTIDNIDNLIGINYNNNSQFNETINKDLLELPQLPQLPESITENIEKEIKNVEKEELPDNVFTKEEVDEMIGMKLKNFEAEMNKIKNESEKLAKELEKRKQEEEENKKQKKFASILNTTQSEITAPAGGNVPPIGADGTPPGVGGDTIQSLEEKKAEEERQLKLAQRARIMQERRASNMFKMRGGGGGTAAQGEDEDSIIILNKDSLHNIKEQESEVTTTKTADLSRTIAQGKIISAVLENAINTDVQNQVRAIISRDIYSESGKNILIPKGSRVIGIYQSTTSTTIARLNISWNRIIRADGLNISISSSTADNLGRGGVEGDLDNKYTQVIKNAFLSSVISIAGAALVDKITDTVTTTTTSGTETTTTTNATNEAIIDASETFSDEMQSLVDGLKAEKPTIRISQGTKINIVVNQDLTLPIFKQKDI